METRTWILDADCSQWLLCDLARQSGRRSTDTSPGEGMESQVCAVGPSVPDWMHQTVVMLKDREIVHSLHRR